MLVGVVTLEEGGGGKVDVGNGVVKEGDESSTTRSTRMILTHSGVVREGVGWQVLGLFQFGFL